MLSNLPIADIAIVLVALLISLGIHEAMHAFTAHSLGDTTAADQGRLTLNPLKHIDLMTTVFLPLLLMLVHLPPIFIAKPVPFDPSRVRYGEFGSALIALAGPFSNLALAVVAALVARFGGFGLQDEWIVHFLVLFLQVNVGLFIFNMIPFPPLDGSRLLYAFAPEPIQKVMQQIESAGLLALFAFIILFVPLLGPVISSLNRTIIEFLLFSSST